MISFWDGKSDLKVGDYLGVKVTPYESKDIEADGYVVGTDSGGWTVLELRYDIEGNEGLDDGDSNEFPMYDGYRGTSVMYPITKCRTLEENYN